MGCAALVATLWEQPMPTAPPRTAWPNTGRINTGGFCVTRAPGTAADTTPLKINSDLYFLLFYFFLRFISAEWLPVLSLLPSLGAYSHLNQPALSNSVFSVF